jgi:hypothetical protein
MLVACPLVIMNCNNQYGYSLHQVSVVLLNFFDRSIFNAFHLIHLWVVSFWMLYFSSFVIALLQHPVAAPIIAGCRRKRLGSR